MTTNQLIAMCFPLLTVAAVGLTGLVVLKIWGAEKRKEGIQDDNYARVVEAEEASMALRQASNLINRVERQLHHQR